MRIAQGEHLKALRQQVMEQRGLHAPIAVRHVRSHKKGIVRGYTEQNLILLEKGDPIEPVFLEPVE